MEQRMSSPCSNCGADIRVCVDCDLYNGKLIERKMDKWIPIMENLPKTPGFYFVTYKDDDDRGNEFTDVTEGFWTGREWVKDFLKKLDIIAWMPKMEPYEKGAEE